MMREQRPVFATLAIFTFNQKDVIIEALEAALSQDYENLEIIISDDCSSDETFQTCQDFLSHSNTECDIRLRQTKQNNGTYSHVLEVAQEAKGEVFIVAAGDDISKPNRVSRIVEAWKKTKFRALYSDYDVIDDSGGLIAENVTHTLSDRIQWVFAEYERAVRVSGHVLNIAGCSAAYDCSFLKNLPRPNKKIFSEDGLLTYLINTQGGIIHRIPESLMYYRLSDSSISGIKGADSLEMFIKSEQRLCAFAQSNYEMYSYLRDRISNEDISNIGRVDRKFEMLQKYSSYVSSFWELNAAQRFLFAFRNPVLDRLSFFLPRSLGMRAFLFAKKITRKRGPNF